MRMQFNDDKRVLPAVCFAFVLGIVLMLSSVWGHVHVYLLQDAATKTVFPRNIMGNESNEDEIGMQCMTARGLNAQDMILNDVSPFER